MGCTAFVFVLATWLVTLPFSVAGDTTFYGIPVALAMLVVPLGWWLSFYLATLFICGLYNLCARHFGGLVVETSEAAAQERAASLHVRGNS